MIRVKNKEWWGFSGIPRGCRKNIEHIEGFGLKTRLGEVTS